MTTEINQTATEITTETTTTQTPPFGYAVVYYDEVKSRQGKGMQVTRFKDLKSAEEFAACHVAYGRRSVVSVLTETDEYSGKYYRATPMVGKGKPFLVTK
jgi:hypothetical protein